jgi:HAD superfamily hydrolase (TIGR01549 family)
MIKGLIFDLDGTITNTLPLCVKAFRQALEPLAGRQFSDEEIVATFGPSEEGTVDALAHEHYDKGLSDYLLFYREQIATEHGPSPSLTEWLSCLKRSGVRLALVTGKGAGSTAITLAKFNLSEYFEHVGTGSRSGPVKEKRIAEVVEKWGFSLDEIAYVGDAPSDVVAAKNVGVKMILANWFAHDEAPNRLDADVCADSVEEAQEWLTALK